MNKAIWLTFCLIYIAFSGIPIKATSNNSGRTLISRVKPYTLRVLNLIPISGQILQGDADLIVVISNWVAEQVNQRNDILPDYHIEFDFKDENMGYLSATQVIDYSQGFEDDKAEGNVIKSPIVLGPEYSTGCKAIGPVLKHLSLVDLSSMCSAPIFADHSRYPNLYLMVPTGQFAAFALLHFIREIGNWSRFALLTNAANVNDYGTAMFIQKIAIEKGFNIPWFTMVLTVDEAIVSALKETDARIIVFFTGNDNLVMKFLCLAHKFGMKGSRYVFIVNYSTFSDPTTFPTEIFPGCPATTLIEQFNQTYWVGPAFQIEDKNIKSHWSLGQNDFDQVLNNVTNPAASPDYPFRFLFHDYVLRGIYALHDTELALKRDFNKTLRDYREDPDLVMKVANKSLLELKISGLRIGDMSYGRSGLGEGDAEVMVHWSPETADKTVITVHQHANSTDFLYDSYFIKRVRPATWITKDGRPPKDDMLKVKEVKTAYYATTLAIATVGTALGFLQFIAILVCLAGLFRTKSAVLRRLSPSEIPVSKAFGIIGAVCMTLAGIFIGQGHSENREDARSFVVLQICLATFGLSIVNGVAISRIFVINWEPLPEPSTNNNARDVRRSSRISGRVAITTSTSRLSVSSSVTRPSTSQSRSLSETKVPMAVADRDKRTAVGTLIIAIVHGFALSVWLTRDPVSCSLIPTKLKFYDFDSDTFFETFIMTCDSKRMMQAVIGIAACHMLALLLGLKICFGLRGEKLRLKTRFTRWCPEYAFISAGLVNALALLVASILITAAVSDPINRQLVLAGSCLVYSFMATLISVSPSIPSTPTAADLVFQIMMREGTNTNSISKPPIVSKC